MEQSSIDKNLKAREDNTRRCIANISDAISTVVSHSTNDEFRRKCFSLLKVPNTSGLASAVSSELKSISNPHLGITLPSNASSTECVFSETPIGTDSPQLPSSRLLEDQTSEIATTDLNDFDMDFSDFFDDVKETAPMSETVCQIPAQLENAALTSDLTPPPKSTAVPKSSLVEEDWFEEVLNSDLFFNES